MRQEALDTGELPPVRHCDAKGQRVISIDGLAAHMGITVGGEQEKRGVVVWTLP